MDGGPAAVIESALGDRRSSGGSGGMTEHRPIMVAHTYAELADGFAMWLAEIKANYSSVEAACEMAEGHLNKLLSPLPTKHFGARTLDKFLEKAGLVLVVAADPDRSPQFAATREHAGDDMLTRRASRLRKREGRDLLRENLRMIGRKARRGRMKKIDPQRRSEIASNAARARWGRNQAVSLPVEA
jgi:hypothetical protein